MSVKKWLISLIMLIIGLGIGLGISRTLPPGTDASAAKHFAQPVHTDKHAKRVFINASMNTNGTTAKMAKDLFGDLPYQQINLRDYNIPQIGQGNGDFDKVWQQLKGADVIVIGTPVYWSNMSGYLKTFIDHMQINNDLKGSDLYVIVQGTDKNQTAAINSTYGSLNRIAKRFQMHFVGIAQTNSQIHRLHQKMIGK